MNKNNEIETKYTITAPSDSYSSEETFDNYEDAYRYCIETEIIYYNRAMEYLSEHDWSLTESAEIASDLGFELKNINSEMLATIHLQEGLINSIRRIEAE
jgi:hypothetical protein